MYNEVATLKKAIITQDEYLNQVETYEDTEVFVMPKSVSQSEFYRAATSDLHPSLVLVIKDSMDYDGQNLVEYGGTLYSVLRTYINRESIELTLTEKIGNE